MNNNHKIIPDKAIRMLCNEYDALQHIKDFQTRVKEAKRQAIKTILNRCVCWHCQDACYQIETLKFY
jgi:hypothetical protein